jgi:hypothetical protein
MRSTKALMLPAFASAAPMSRNDGWPPSNQISCHQCPETESKFQGTIGKSYSDSKPDWPKVPTPPEGAPNVVVILLDDVGFAELF